MGSNIKQYLIAGTLIAASFFVPGSGLISSYLASSLFYAGAALAVDAIQREFLAEKTFSVKSNVVNTQRAIPLVYGTARVGLSIADSRNVDSSDGDTPSADPSLLFASAEDNDIHLRVGALCLGGEGGQGIEGVDDIRFYNDEVAAIASPGTGDMITTGLLTDYGGYAKYTIRLGDDAQTVPSSLLTQLGWTTNYKGVGVAYFALAALYTDHDDDTEDPWIRGFPSITAEIQGVHIWDPRGTPAWAYSNNSALCILDYLTSKRYGAGYFYPERDGGDASLSQIDVQSFIDAANHCEEQVSVPSGTQDRFKFNGVIDTSVPVETNLSEMLFNCRAQLIWQGGKIRIHIRKSQTATTFELTEDNIIGEWQWVRRGNVPNIMEVSYVNPRDGDYVVDSLSWPLAGDTTFLDQDNGIENRVEVDLSYTQNREQALQTIMVMLREERQDIIINVTANQEALELEVGDVVPLTHSTPGWTSKEFWVVGMGLTPQGDTRLSLWEYDSDVYSLDSLLAAATLPGTNLPSVNFMDPPTDVTATSDSTTALNTQEDYVIPRTLIAWTPPVNSPFLRGYEIQQKLFSEPSTAWRTVSRPTKDDIDTYIIGITNLESYDFRIAAVNVLSVRSVWVSITNQSINTLDSTRITNAFLQDIPFVDTTGGTDGITEDIRPDGDVTSAEFTTAPLFSKINGDLPDTGDFISTGDGDVCPTKITYTDRVTLGNPVGTPAASDQQAMTLRIAARKQFTGGVAGDHEVDVIVRLYQDTTLIATLTELDIGTTFNSFSLQLTNSQVDNITNHALLEVEYEMQVCFGTEGNTVQGDISGIEIAYSAKTPVVRGTKVDLIYDVTAEVDELDITVYWDDGGGLTSFSYTKSSIGGVAGRERLQMVAGGTPTGDLFLREDWTTFSVDVIPVAQPADTSGRLVALSLQDPSETPAGVKAKMSSGGAIVLADYLVPGAGITFDLDVDGRPEVSATGGGGANELDDLTDVTITTVINGHVLQHNGTVFVNRTLAAAGISAVGHTHPASEITVGTFGAGNYVFPGNLDVTGNLVLQGAGRSIDFNDDNVIISRATVAKLTMSATLTTHENSVLINTPNDAGLEISHTSAVGSPRLNFSQLGTDRSYIQHIDSGDNFYIVSIVGDVRIAAGDADRVYVQGGSGYVHLLGSTSEEQLRIDSASSTGSPYISLFQNGTRRSYIQHADSGDKLILASEYGTVELWPGVGGSEVMVMQIKTTDIVFTQEMRGLDGFVSSPTYSWENEADSGMWLAGSNKIGFSTIGVLRFTIEGVDLDEGVIKIDNAGMVWDPVVHTGLSFTVDWQTGNVVTHEWTGNCTVTLPAEAVPDAGYVLHIIHNYVSGSATTATYTVPSGAVKWRDGVAPPPPTSGKATWVTFVYDGTNVLGDHGIYS